MPTFEERPPSQRHPPTVLVVEDEPTPRTEICRMVRGLGYQVRTARDGREALRYLEQHPGEVRLVLSDVIMPYMDGGELAERVRDRLPGVRIVLMSDSLEGGAGELVAAYPETPFLAKPFSFAELYATLSGLVGPPGVPGGPKPAKPAFHRDREPRT
jgi:two-component system cell cycle sensor histidine kinase/response regulator CckA